MALGAEICPPQLGRPHTHTVILLHGETHKDGLDFANDFLAARTSGPVGQQRTIRDLFPTVRWVFPHAPWLHSQRDGNITLRTVWLDMQSVDDIQSRDRAQVVELRSNIEEIHNIIQVEQSIIHHEKIFMGGFGQGFAVAYAAYFLYHRHLAGLIGVGGFLPRGAMSNAQWQEDEVYTMIFHQELPTPIFLSHSRDDNVVPVEEGRAMRIVIEIRTNARLEYHEYDHGGAWMNVPKGVDDLVAFLARHINSLPSSLTSFFSQLRI
ncbi:alpha/beta-hydrolase [Hypoxylon sp. FL0543]|nr:alpha/beta-hydrolase [Hypoxylon sp. FL0543]